MGAAFKGGEEEERKVLRNKAGERTGGGGETEEREGGAVTLITDHHVLCLNVNTNTNRRNVSSKLILSRTVVTMCRVDIIMRVVAVQEEGRRRRSADKGSDDQTGLRRRLGLQLNRVEHSSAPFVSLFTLSFPLVVSVRLLNL